MKHFITLLVCFLAIGFTFADHAKTEKKDLAPNFTLKDINGKNVSLADFKGKTVVLEWVNFDCPFVKKHYSVNNMQGLQEKYTKQGIIWLSICSSAKGKQGHFSGEDAKARVKKENAKPTAYLSDEDGTVGKLYDAKTTPHMFVISGEGEFLYKGAIDSDRSVKSESIKEATNYVAQTLDAVLSGKGEIPANTKSYGCSVKYGK